VTAAQRGYAVLMIMLASTPLVIAYFADKWAEKNMTRPWIIGAALAVGGVIILVIEWLPLNVTTRRIERVTWKQALGIGGAQVLAAVFPGTSRSAATIMAGMVAGLSRPAAAEFSFFLAIPAMGAACLYKLLKFLKHGLPPATQILLLVIGTLVSFLVAFVVIAAFMAYIRRHNFIPFAVYRIALGLLVLWLTLRGAAPAAG
jgi:undecaprenyl-diphosphatase